MIEELELRKIEADTQFLSDSKSKLCGDLVSEVRRIRYRLGCAHGAGCKCNDCIEMRMQGSG